MGLPIGYHRCSSCGTTERLGAGFRQQSAYQCANGVLVAMRTADRWCHDCDALHEAEDLSLAHPLRDLARAADLLSTVHEQRSLFRRRWHYLGTDLFDDTRSPRELQP